MLMQFGYDRRIPSMGVLSNLHWLEGRPAEAVRLGAVAVDEARRSPYPVPLCEALTWQALNLHLCGDQPGAVEDLLDEALACARPHFIESYVGLSLALKGLGAATRGDFAGADLASQGLELLSKSHYEFFHPLFVTELARLRAQAGVRASEEEVAALLRWAAPEPEDWSSAEVRRNVGEVLSSRGESERAAKLFADAADCAARQGALGWALRVALSVARSAGDEDSRRRATTHLAALLQRSAEGEETADLRAARLFLLDRSDDR
jgi:hypothetical protein